MKTGRTGCERNSHPEIPTLDYLTKWIIIVQQTKYFYYQASHAQGCLFLGALELLHAVEGAAGAEPLDLLLVEGVVEGDGLGGAIGLLDDALEGLLPLEDSTMNMRHKEGLIFLPN
jgi:hypothetical protein